MTVVFVAGSLSIKRLHPLFVERIRVVVESGFSVIVGDADGADTAIQEALIQCDARDVTVYCTGNSPRNNVGKWPVKTVSSLAEPGTRTYFQAKDIEMASVADYGLMIWDAKSSGTLNNVIELLSNRRSCRVFVNKQRTFVTISSIADLRNLTGLMSDGARAQAERKIKLSTKIERMAHEQYDMPFN